MFLRRGLLVGSLVTITAVAGALFVTGALGSSAQPANKVVAAGSTTAVMSPNDTPITLLTATMNTSKPTDLSLLVTAECSILTTVTNVGTSTEDAHGQVRVWTEVDGQIVPVQSTSSPPQNTPPAGTDTDKAVFCEREHQVQFTPDTSNESISQFQKTKNADAFNWLRFNVGAGTHTITVKGELHTDATSSASAEAIVGNRTLIVDPTHMANNAVISSTGTG
jgi:hypothetical protein